MKVVYLSVALQADLPWWRVVQSNSLSVVCGHLSFMGDHPSLYVCFDLLLELSVAQNQLLNHLFKGRVRALIRWIRPLLIEAQGPFSITLKCTGALIPKTLVGMIPPSFIVCVGEGVIALFSRKSTHKIHLLGFVGLECGTCVGWISYGRTYPTHPLCWSTTGCHVLHQWG